HRVNTATCEGHALGVCAADIEDAISVLHVLDRRLRRYKDRSYADGQRSIKVRELEILDGTHDRDSRVVDENVNAAQFRQRAFDDGDHGTGISAVSLNGQGANSERLRCLDAFAASIGRTRISQRDIRAFAGQTFDDGGSDAPATSGDKSAFVLQCL